MAELLGGQSIIESLSNDVQDLQWAINEIVSRIGPVQHSSWKFPDQLSCDLDIEDLLDLYSYSDDEEESQVAHIALYELVIDRFVYLVQTLSAYNKKLLQKVGQDAGDNKSMSIGNVIKQYCNRQIQLQTLVQHTISENKTKQRQLLDMEYNMKKMTGQLQEDGSSIATGSLSSLHSVGQSSVRSNSSTITPMYTARHFVEVALDANSKHCQTVETAFVPCEACHIVQKHFRHAGDIVITMCKNQQLPCSLQQFRPLVADSKWLTANDIARWAGEQNKDLSRVHKNMDSLVEKISSLKDEVATFEKKNKSLAGRVASFDIDMGREREVQSAIRRQYDIKVKELEQTHKEHMSVVTRDRDQNACNKEFLEKQLQQLQETLGKQTSLIQNMEKENVMLEGSLKEKKATTDQVQKLQMELSSVEKNLEEIRNKHDSSTKELARELAKGKSSAKHSKSIQSKQESLVQRVDMLDQENEELKSQMSDLEEEKEQLEESLQKVTDDVNKWQTKINDDEKLISHLSKEKEKLQESVARLDGDVKKLEKRVQESTERERLIIEYPDLNGPVNPDLAGSGDIVIDMQNQVKANSVRIQVLDEQNAGLRNSISKVMQTQKQGPVQAWQEEPHQQSTPMQLWNSESRPPHNTPVHSNIQDGQAHWSPDRSHLNKNNSAEPRSRGTTRNKSAEKRYSSPDKHFDDTHATYTTPVGKLGGDNYKRCPTPKSPPEEFVVGRSVRPPSSNKRKDGTYVGSTSRPQSGKTTMTPVNHSSIGAYIQMKKSLNPGERPPVQRPVSGKLKPGPREVTMEDNPEYMRSEATYYSCVNCDKMYTKERDLEIHKSYCTG